MSTSAIVQFIRNFLCCIKDLSYGAYHQHNQPNQINLSWMYNYTITNQYMYEYFNISLIEPIKYTTPLEMIISITQLYVVLSGVPESIQRFIYSYYQMKRTNTLLQYHYQQSNNTNNTNGTIKNHVDRLLYVSLIKELNTCKRSIFIALNCFCISIAFIWLSANSLHITKTVWIGGLPALIHALTIMNICLIPLLYYMYIDSIEYYSNSKRIQYLYQQLLVGTVTSSDIGLSAIYAFYNMDYIPFYSCNYTTKPTPIDIKNIDNDDIQLLNHERRKIQAVLDIITGKIAITKKIDDPTTNDTNEIQQQQQQQQQILIKQIQKDIANTTNLPSIVYKYQLYSIREFIYFLLNCIAWYGYGMCIVVYYYPYTILHQNNDIIRILLFYLNSNDADWYGNFIGDIMWTIEPIIILCSPILIHQLIQLSTSTSKSSSQQNKTTTTTTNIPNLIASVIEQNEKSKIE